MLSLLTGIDSSLRGSTVLEESWVSVVSGWACVGLPSGCDGAGWLGAGPLRGLLVEGYLEWRWIGTVSAKWMSLSWSQRLLSLPSPLGPLTGTESSKSCKIRLRRLSTSFSKDLRPRTLVLDVLPSVASSDSISSV